MTNSSAQAMLELKDLLTRARLGSVDAEADILEMFRAAAAPVAVLEPVAAALARRLCQMFDSGGESQRSARARHASAIFQLLNRDTPQFLAEQSKCDADPVAYLEAAVHAALTTPEEASTAAGEAVTAKLNEPAFKELGERLDRNINDVRRLALVKIRPTGVDKWLVSTPSGSVLIINDADWLAAAPPAAQTDGASK